MRKDESCLHLLYLLKLHMMNSVVDLLLIVKGESYDSHMSWEDEIEAMCADTGISTIRI